MKEMFIKLKLSDKLFSWFTPRNKTMRKPDLETAVVVCCSLSEKSNAKYEVY